VSEISRSFQNSWLNGRLQIEKSADETETCRGFYPSGELHFVYPKKDDVFHGACLIWYKNGATLAVEHYLHGKREGLFREYFEDGSLAGETTYHDDLCTGARTAWHDNGNLCLQDHYKNGNRHGPQRCWNHDGSLMSESFFIRSIRVPHELWDHLSSETLTAPMICQIENVTLRRACLEELGYARFLSQVRHRVIEKKGDEALIRIRNWHRDEEDICLVKVRCPSTGAFYALRVPPGTKTIRAGVAWTFALDEKDYFPEKET